MRTLVCQPKGSVSTVRLYTDQEALVEGEFEAWTLLNGRQILAVERRLHKLLERQYIGGTYEQGALYALEYAEMCAVLRDQLGPSDRDRYLRLQQSTRPRVEWRAGWYAVWRAVCLVGFVLYKTIATIVFFGVVAVLLNLFKKHR